jgi:hypothetical protein
MAGEVLLGHIKKAYLDPSGVGGSTWSELKQASDIKIPRAHNRVEVDERGEPYVLEALGRTKAEVQMSVTCRPGATNYETLRTAFINKTGIGFAFCTGAIATAGTKGWRADMLVADFPDDGAMEGDKIEVVLVIDADGDDRGSFFTVSA